MDRAVSPVAGTCLLVGITVVLSAAIGAAAYDVSTPIPSRPVVLSVSASAADDRVTVVHRGGPTLDVRTITVRIEVDGTPLTHQPPIPFFAAKGYRAGPTGAFNSAADPRFGVTERASLRVASTNDPSLAPGATLAVVLFRNGTRIAMATTRIE